MNRLVVVLVVIIGVIGMSCMIEAKESMRLRQFVGSPVQLMGKRGSGGWTETGWFQTRLDNFDQTNNRTFELRYQVNDTLWGGPGYPVFFFLCGEASCDFFSFQTVQIRETWAEQNKALYVQLEHRYYGESQPFAIASTENLRFLSSEQALADAAEFLSWFDANKLPKKEGAPPSKYVTFGCSYSGALSAWFRLKYPHLTVGSVAPSGPVLAQLNYTGYYGWFTHPASAECSSSVQQASNQIYAQSQNAAGLAQLSTAFKTCQPLDSNNTWYFLNTLMEVVGGSDQMNNPPDWPLNATCNKLLSSPSSGVDGVIQNWANLALGGSSCLDVDEQALIEELRLPIPSASRAWWMQKCTEFGFMKPSYPGTSIFFPNLHLQHFVRYCEQGFGIPGMTPNIQWTNNNYGGKDLSATNVMFTNGLMDPWHLLSITDPTSSGVHSVTYNAGHCAPLTAAYPDDPPSLLSARQEVAAFIQSILK